MAFAEEKDFEKALIELLSTKGWEKDVLRFPTEEDLIQNWANILFENNREKDRLNDYRLTRTEMQQLIEQIIALKTPFNPEKSKIYYKFMRSVDMAGSFSNEGKYIKGIKQKILELKTPYEQAMAKADEWRKNALNNLNTSSADYQKYKDQIGQVYDDMVKKANETALQSSKSLEDGFKRGFLNIQKDVNDFASLTESAVKNAFNSMEDTLTSFITTGKASFSDFANAIISDLTRIIIRQSITQPLMNGLGSYLGFAMAHTGGIVGADNLALKSASPLAFAGAPRFHSGGIIGDEVPIIAKRGEGVFTREQMKALGDNGSTVNISVNVVNNAASDVKASVSQSNQGNGKFNLDIMIEKIESSMSRNVSKGTGIAPALERRYGLNPAYGSYG